MREPGSSMNDDINRLVHILWEYALLHHELKKAAEGKGNGLWFVYSRSKAVHGAKSICGVKKDVAGEKLHCNLATANV